MLLHVRLLAAGALAATLGCNGDGGSTTPVGPSQPVAPTSVNRAPRTSDGIPDQAIFLGDEKRLDMQGYFTDPDGDPLTYEATSSNTHVAEVSVAENVVILMAMNLGRADIRVVATDPGGLTATQTFSVTGERPPNRAPRTSAALPDQTLTLHEYESTRIDLNAYFTDPDGDPLTYEATSSNAHVATAGVSSNTLTLVARHLGRADISVTASDSGGLTATQRFSLTVEQGEPRAELEITKCQADGLGVVNVTVEGTVRAVTGLSSVRITAYVDTHRLGEQALGDVPAGEIRGFLIRGSAPVSSTSQCNVEFMASGRAMAAAAFMSFR